MPLMSTYFCHYACAMGQLVSRQACLELELEFLSRLGIAHCALRCVCLQDAG